MYKTCDGCVHAQMVYRSDWGEERLRCMRDRTMRDGRIVRAEGVGASVVFETDQIDEPQRVKGDKCGPERRHWAEKGAAT